MRKIFNIKNWLLYKNPQFKMCGDGMASRLKDGLLFSNSGEYSMVNYQGRRANILEFMSNYVHIQIEVMKPGVRIYKGMEFDTDDYEVIEVPINEVSLRSHFASPSDYTKEEDDSQNRQAY